MRRSLTRSAAPAATGTPLARLIGGRIAALRVERGWSQRDLAALAGIIPSRLDLYEKGRHEPPLRTLKRLARALAVPLEALVEERARKRRKRTSSVDLVQQLRQSGQEGAAAVLDILVGLERLIDASQRRSPAPPTEKRRCTTRARQTTIRRS